MDLRELIAIGERLGLAGDELKKWMDTERARERDERAAEREAVRQHEEREIGATRERMELEARNLQLRIQLAESGATATDSHRNRANGEVGLQTGDVPHMISPHKLVPVFDDKHDDLDAYLQRFERVATGQGWHKDKWATALSMCLAGEALRVFGRMSPEDSLDYEKTKLCLLQRFRFTSEGYREKFRGSKPEDGETGKQFSSRLENYFDRWVDMNHTPKTYDGLRDQMVAEQFLSQCHLKLAVFLRERDCKTVSQLSESADRFLEAQRQINLGAYKDVNKVEKNACPLYGAMNNARVLAKCFLCGRGGHKAADCRAKREDGPPYCRFCRRQGHDSRSCTQDRGDKPEGSCFVSPQTSTDKSNAINSTTENERETTHSNETDIINRVQGENILSSSRSMPVMQGIVNDRLVRVLRDTGSNTVIVRRDLVPPDSFLGVTSPVFLVDGSCKMLPEAKITVRSPYFSGELIAKTMENPLYDLIIGNIVGSRGVDEPDFNWEVNLTSQSDRVLKNEKTDDLDIQGQRVAAATTKGKVPSGVTRIGEKEVTREALEQNQKTDVTLKRCFKETGQIHRYKSGSTHTFYVFKGLLYRRYQMTSGKSFKQLVVPKSLREYVLQVAHDNAMAGHQGIKRTTDRVQEAFFWPGISADIKRYVSSCDKCQKTIPKGKVAPAPLGRMPIIDTPFERVAIDIIGPLTPTSEKGNRYILTMVDFASRYPDAVALPSFDTKTVAEGLLDMFTRVGLPREILSDRGTSFTSDLMKEITNLLSIRQLTTTPYHPMCNGLVERFNGTLKLMLKKMCQEKPRTWDRYLAPLLFAYREVPQSSLGFSPFELIYGRHVRGPLTLLKELWTDDGLKSDLKTTYAYVLELRDRLEQTMELAHQQITVARERQKKFYDRRAQGRQLKVGERALILLPTSHNKLLMQWKGPYPVVGKKNEIDYVIDLGHTTKMFHINMLKRYEERKPWTDDRSQANSFVMVEEGEEPFPSLSNKDVQTQAKVVICQDLTDAQKSDIEAILQKFAGVFSDTPGRAKLLECNLRLSTEIPIFTQQYPIPFAMKDTVESEVKEMLQLGIIEKSDSPYNSPLVLVKKPDKTFRVCIDFRHLNNVLVTDAEPIPRTDTVFAEVGTKRYFSKFDLVKGYWQIPMTEEAKTKTAFSTSSGHFHFKYMPFGIKTAAAVFTRLMRTVLEGLPNVQHYIDDVLVATDTWEEHLNTLSDLFQRIEEAGLTIKPKKCEVGMSTVTFLGHKIGCGKIEPMLSTLEKIIGAKRPTTKKQVRSFLGLAGYYREYIPQYAELAQPLVDLTRKLERHQVNWTSRHEDAFRNLKKALATGPILRTPDLSKSFVLRTDASSTCVGAVLMQEHEGTLHPVAYASKQLLPREVNYSTIERECLALVWAVKKFHLYLYGTHFKVQTDHQPLQYLNKAKQLNSRVLRWSLTLQEYSFTIEHIKGTENVGADYLSRA